MSLVRWNSVLSLGIHQWTSVLHRISCLKESQRLQSVRFLSTDHCSGHILPYLLGRRSSTPTPSVSVYTIHCHRVNIFREEDWSPVDPGGPWLRNSRASCYSKIPFSLTWDNKVSSFLGWPRGGTAWTGRGLIHSCSLFRTSLGSSGSWSEKACKHSTLPITPSLHITMSIFCNIYLVLLQ